jgi:hypothetical protein
VVRYWIFLFLALNGSRSECVVVADEIWMEKGWEGMERGEFLPWKKEETGRRSEFCLLWFVYGQSGLFGGWCVFLRPQNTIMVSSLIPRDFTGPWDRTGWSKTGRPKTGDDTIQQERWMVRDVVAP